ncbi:hypothetical protein GCM10009665_37420 [Kitasatospora nipponensis]|uniref:Uncharacterized protein n=1 Tax=Kitasatospora nipponensis TaxID=258049 RepID=A0ABP4GYG8_9ACTN
MSSPVGHLVHTDGRVGVEGGSLVFPEIDPSIPAHIESHALIDMVSTWDHSSTDVDGFALAR